MNPEVVLVLVGTGTMIVGGLLFGLAREIKERRRGWCALPEREDDRR